ncbi:hypothetical protein [Massilia eburnea]|uniref:hypothetical protein n=1 Tax=Massilia eburnea TaxID=1776165 RepID=UPI003D6BD154
MRTVLVGAAIAVMTNLACASESVLCGRALGQASIEDVQVPCPVNSLCLSGWTRWGIKVEKVISGASVPVRINAVSLEHGILTPKHEEALRIFTVKPIEKNEKRDLFGADFVLLQHEVDRGKDICN